MNCLVKACFCVASSVFLFLTLIPSATATSHENENVEISSQCLQPVANDLYQVACTQPDGDAHEVWVIPGSTHLTVLLSGHPEFNSSWPQIVRQRWPDKQIQILDLQSDCALLHVNERLADWFSIPLSKSPNGLPYSMDVLASKLQFVEFKRSCQSMSGIVFPGGGIKGRAGKLALGLDIGADWNFQLEPDGAGAWQLLVFNPKDQIALIPRFLDMADSQSDKSGLVFNRFAFWVNRLQGGQYKVFSIQGEVSNMAAQAALDVAIQSQLTAAMSQVRSQDQASITHSH
ncbi:hypothetical protein [Limnobacter litoralis]|uniref:hypothetical protein n=1 Tax=Limnobacter litoralis TaxID=481366 RepID=UPI0024E0D6E5|nr:hypothetical protein [Limnobacter litoralis]